MKEEMAVEALIQKKAQKIDDLLRELEARGDRKEIGVLSKYIELIGRLRDEIERLKSERIPRGWI